MSENTKPLDIVMLSLITVGLFIFALLVALTIAHSMFDFDGITIVNPIAKVETVMATTTIATEASECKAQGGEFSISNVFSDKQLQTCNEDRWCITPDARNATGYILTCTQPEKTLSSVTIKI